MVLLSIVAPFALLIYQTLMLRISATPVCYGKWLLLFILTSLANLLSIITDSYLFVIVDLGLKISVCLLPTAIVLLPTLRTTNSNIS